MNNLIAYIPVPSQRYLDWISTHPDSKLHLIDQEMAESLIPRLSRNMSALPTIFALEMLSAIGRSLDFSVFMFHPTSLIVLSGSEVILPDEDVSHAFAEKYLEPTGIQYTFEAIWARWDMSAVKSRQPVLPDYEISRRDIDIFRIREAESHAEKSPDWWRQIGAMAFSGEKLIACGWNKHFPTEYETDIFGDPRINFDAGDPAGSEIYLSLHAEKALIAFCAREGISLKGSSVYVTTFPCGDCARFLAECQIKELFFFEGYSFLKGAETLRNAGVNIIQVLKDPESA